LKLDNEGKLQLYPDVKPRKSIFPLLATIRVFNPGFITSPDCFTFGRAEITKKRPPFNIEK
jgi:hypothetical protein